MLWVCLFVVVSSIDVVNNLDVCDITRYTDMESEDYPFFQGLVYLLENDVSTLGYELTFSTEVCIVFQFLPSAELILKGQNVNIVSTQMSTCHLF